MAPAEEGTLAAACGFHMPAEWEPHAHIWMGWPQRTDNWRNDAMPAQAAFVEVASAISRFTPVTICANASQASELRVWRLCFLAVIVHSLCMSHTQQLAHESGEETAGLTWLLTFQ